MNVWLLKPAVSIVDDKVLRTGREPVGESVPDYVRLTKVARLLLP